MLETSGDTVFHAAKRAKNSNSEQRPHLQITAPQKLMALGGFIFLPKPHNWPLPYHVSFSCLLQPHTATPLGFFSKQWDEYGGITKFMVLGHFVMLDSSETPQQGCGEESGFL